MKLPTIQAEISSLNHDLENLESTDDISTIEAKAAITIAIGKEFQDDVEISSTNKDINTNFKKNINNAIKTMNKIIHRISFNISLPSMDKDMRKALLEEFTKNAVNIKMLFVEKHRSNNRLIINTKHLEHLKISDNNDNNKDFIENTNSDNSMIANLILKP
ncbi:hypothetical protein CIHG_07639 [Coccidioides immitis H538.4]|uniref:Uncharacterized protein n=1 Tax=Coccidioides immitis H538.4 TaxID=396776 RepID=A0A0J8RZE2_COCIT|nr:hypothetical protein CIHG_07639 [Coccidioides immitis H538.4]